MSLVLALLITLTSSARADETLPYSIRTKKYSGWSSTVRGDIPSIGMSGATVAIPNSISSVETNPAGLVMTMGSVSAQINSNSMEDTRVAEGKRVQSNQWGLAVSPPPWGFSITYYTPTHEGGRYVSPNTGASHETEVSLKQLRLSVARTFLDQRLALGLGVELDKAIRDLGNSAYDGYDVNVKLGAIVKLPNHFLIGASISPPVEVGTAEADSGMPDLPGFAQPVQAPLLIHLGTGWIPNRFFRVGASVIGVGPTPNTGLLRDEKLLVGRSFTLQPRFGASYVVAEYQNFKVEVAAGSYYEVTRIDGFPNRVHGTFGIEVNPWFINTGFGIDRAENYNNVILSVGADIVRLLRTFDIIPKDPVPPYRGWGPNPVARVNDGLPDALTAGEKKEHSAPSVGDVKEIIENIPENIGRKFKGEEPVDPKAPSKKKKKPKKPAKPPAPKRP